MVVLELLGEEFVQRSAKNAFHVSRWTFWWKTNVLKEDNFSNNFWLWEKNVRILDKNFCASSSKLHWRVRKKCLRKAKVQLENFQLFSWFSKDHFSSFWLKTLAGFLRLKSTCPAEDLRKTIIRTICIFIIVLGYPVSGSGVPVKKTVVAGGGCQNYIIHVHRFILRNICSRNMSFILFQVLTKKDSRNLTKNLRPGCNFCIYATSRTFSAKADFFKLVFVLFVLWAIIPGVSVEISENGCQNCILRFQKCFLTFFSKIYNVITFLDFEKNTFHFLAKRFQKGCRTCLYESNRVFWREKFLLIKISTFYDWLEFRIKTFEHSTKKWVELPKLQFICPAEVFEKKKLSEKN